MDLAQLTELLSDPGAYPGQVETIEIRHTHISIVFLAGPHVYKVKKAVKFGFLDFSTLAHRRRYCEEEVRLNRRLAPEVYVGVVPVTRGQEGVKLEGEGVVVEWAVKMHRLPDDANLQNRLRRGEIGVDVAESLARKIASFHQQAESGPHVAAFGRFEIVARNARENFEESSGHVGTTVSGAVFARLRDLTEAALARHRALIEQRAERGVPRDTHGDLRLGHVYYFPDREPPGDLVIIDCIEFSERFRFADPVSDMAFLFIGFAMQVRRDLAQAFAEAYFRAAGDAEGRTLLSFYSAYRAAVRAKVEGLKHEQPEVPETDHAATLTKARASWLFSLGELEEPGRRPCLVLVGGLPGTGKSTLARALAKEGGFRVIQSDRVRKELAGILREPRPEAFGRGIYTREWTDRTYAECLRRAERLLFEGERVLVDANFRDEARRRDFLETGFRWGVAGVFLLCQAGPSVVQERLAVRRDDASDADWSVYVNAAEAWEEPGELTKSVLRGINTEGTEEQALRQALGSLRRLDLC